MLRFIHSDSIRREERRRDDVTLGHLDDPRDGCLSVSVLYLFVRFPLSLLHLGCVQSPSSTSDLSHHIDFHSRIYLISFNRICDCTALDYVMRERQELL